MNLKNYPIQNDVYILSEVKDHFSDEYIAIREKEGRILSLDQIKNLPVIEKSNPYFKEWSIRKKSTQRILDYLTQKNKSLSILEIGCGNGWFANQLINIKKTNVIGLDVNIQELKQATQCFNKENLQFVYFDVFKGNKDFIKQFDIVVLNGTIQYFNDFELIIKTIKSFLKPKGEIHILDSPFYAVSEISNAKKRTLDYYTKMGVPKMADFYFHHAKESITDFDILYRQKKSILSKFIGQKDSPFFWLRFTL